MAELETAQLIRQMDLVAVTIRLDEITRTNKAERNGVL